MDCALRVDVILALLSNIPTLLRALRASKVTVRPYTRPMRFRIHARTAGRRHRATGPGAHPRADPFRPRRSRRRNARQILAERGVGAQGRAAHAARLHQGLARRRADLRRLCITAYLRHFGHARIVAAGWMSALMDSKRPPATTFQQEVGS